MYTWKQHKRYPEDPEVADEKCTIWECWCGNDLEDAVFLIYWVKDRWHLWSDSLFLTDVSLHWISLVDAKKEAERIVATRASQIIESVTKIMDGIYK